MRFTQKLTLFLAATSPARARHRLRRRGYPERPIELIVPWGPGGGADQLARLISKQLEPMLGQGIPVVNVPGGTGATGMAKLLAAPADGYSMAIYIADSHALLAGKTPRWQMSDITPVAVMMKVPSFIFVKEDSRFKTWADFANDAKANPGKLKIATLGFGSVDDFSLTVLQERRIKFIQVPFSKPSERYVSILGDHADALYEQAGDVAQFLNGKQMRPILLFGEKRLDRFKDVPASYELGYKVALPQFRAIVVKAGTPPDIVQETLRRSGQSLRLGGVQEIHGRPVLRPEQLRGCIESAGLYQSAARGHEEDDGDELNTSARSAAMDQAPSIGVALLRRAGHFRGALYLRRAHSNTPLAAISLGPEFWPRLAILLMWPSVFRITRHLRSPKRMHRIPRSVRA